MVVHPLGINIMVWRVRRQASGLFGSVNELLMYLANYTLSWNNFVNYVWGFFGGRGHVHCHMWKNDPSLEPLARLAGFPSFQRLDKIKCGESSELLKRTEYFLWKKLIAAHLCPAFSSWFRNSGVGTLSVVSPHSLCSGSKKLCCLEWIVDLVVSVAPELKVTPQLFSSVPLWAVVVRACPLERQHGQGPRLE